MAKVCREVFSEVAIHANGKVVCSCMDPWENFPLGNVKEKPIMDIFHGERFADLRNQLLTSDDTTYCQPVGTTCPFKCDRGEEKEKDFSKLTIKKMRLETISHCNLRCPVCAVTEWYENQAANGKGVDPRFARLPLETGKQIISDVKDSLENLWLYNYGEPFLDKNLLELCRHARKTIPPLWILTHTNGTVTPKGWPDQIVDENLINVISFSIDGVVPTAYDRYRKRGNLQKAMDSLKAFAKARDRTNSPIRLIWQYILFEWNDSKSELALAKKIASDIGVEMQWILTHTEGKSERILPDSDEYKELGGVRHYSGQMLADRIDDELEVGGFA